MGLPHIPGVSRRHPRPRHGQTSPPHQDLRHTRGQALNAAGSTAGRWPASRRPTRPACGDPGTCGPASPPRSGPGADVPARRDLRPRIPGQRADGPAVMCPLALAPGRAAAQAGGKASTRRKQDDYQGGHQRLRPHRALVHASRAGTHRPGGRGGQRHHRRGNTGTSAGVRLHLWPPGPDRRAHAGLDRRRRHCDRGPVRARPGRDRLGQARRRTSSSSRPGSSAPATPRRCTSRAARARC